MSQQFADVQFNVVISKNNATANGNDTNIVTAIATTPNGEPIANLDIIFKVDGNALFKDNNGPQYRTKTAANGEAKANIINNIAKDETNAVTVNVLNQPETTQTVYVKFHKAYSPLLIDTASNINQTLGKREPSIIWPGASFIIHTRGGSQDIRWEITGESAGIRLSSDGVNSATVNIIAGFEGVRTLTCHDNITGETVDYEFDVKHSLTKSTVPLKYNELINQATAHDVLDIVTYHDLFRQWGIMSHYDGWPAKAEYWSKEHTALHVETFNLDTGTSHNVSINAAPLNYLFIAGREPYSA